MAGKRNLADMLSGKGSTPEIRRGRGVTLSTETAEAAPEASAPPEVIVQPKASAPPEMAAPPAVAALPETPPAQEPSAPPPVASATLPAVTPRFAAEPGTSPAPPAAPRESVASSPRASSPPRLNRGYAVRPDLAKALKLIAVQEDRTLYDVMEQAMQEFLDRYRATQQKP